MNRVLNAVLIVISVIYPFFLLAGLLWLKVSPRVLVLGLLAIGTVFFLAHSGDAKKKGIQAIQFWIMMAGVAILAVVTFLTENAGFLKLYPVIMNSLWFAGYGYTLYKGPTAIYRIAIAKDKSIPESP
ncbi:MAG: hypothetical protein EHM28_14825, partial [Spirochaetaceae bacterium]